MKKEKQELMSALRTQDTPDSNRLTPVSVEARQLEQHGVYSLRAFLMNRPRYLNVSPCYFKKTLESSIVQFANVPGHKNNTFLILQNAGRHRLLLCKGCKSYINSTTHSKCPCEVYR